MDAKTEGTRLSDFTDSIAMRWSGLACWSVWMDSFKRSGILFEIALMNLRVYVMIGDVMNEARNECWFAFDLFL